jgi:hypothetical protein
MKVVRLLVLVLLLPVIALVQIEIDRRFGAAARQDQTLYVSSGEYLKKMVPGFENVLADIYWLRTVQYFGREHLFATDSRFDLLYPLVDITTTLDPRLTKAYKYGAIFLCEWKPVGKGDAPAGIRILEKGVRAQPNNWRLRQDLGYFRYLFLDDAEGGAAILFEAAKLPGAPYWLVNLGETILLKGKGPGTDRRGAREMWRRIYEQEEDKGLLRDNALQNILRLDALDAVDALNTEVEHFKTRNGRFPREPGELASLGREIRNLSDPTGVPFDYDPERGKFRIGSGSKLWRGDR